MTAPRTVLGVVGRDFPLAAMYFMRFVIFLLGTTPLWLLRLWPLLSRGWRTWTVEPPALPGVLYGWAFPKLMMVLIVCLTYVVIAPLIAPVAFVYFFIISIEFRYLLYYVHIPQYESGGVFWYSCVPRLLFGLTASNAILVAYFVTQNAVQTPFLLPLLLIVPAFGVYFRESYDRRTRRLSLRDAMDKDRALERFLNAHDIDISAEFDRTMYLQPSFKELLGGAAARATPTRPMVAHGNGGEAARAPIRSTTDAAARPQEQHHEEGGVYNPVTGPDDEVDDGAVATARTTRSRSLARQQATARRFSLTRTNLERQLDDAAGDSDLDDIDARGRRGRGSADETSSSTSACRTGLGDARAPRDGRARPARVLGHLLGDAEQAGSTARETVSPRRDGERGRLRPSRQARMKRRPAPPERGHRRAVFANPRPGPPLTSSCERPGPGSQVDHRLPEVSTHNMRPLAPKQATRNERRARHGLGGGGPTAASSHKFSAQPGPTDRDDAHFWCRAGVFHWFWVARGRGARRRGTPTMRLRWRAAPDGLPFPPGTHHSRSSPVGSSSLALAI